MIYQFSRCTVRAVNDTTMFHYGILAWKTISDWKTVDFPLDDRPTLFWPGRDLPHNLLNTRSLLNSTIALNPTSAVLQAILCPNKDCV